MTERTLRTLFSVGGIGTIVIAIVGLRWDVAVSVGVLAGGAWNLLNLWSLGQTLSVWLDAHPSRVRSVAWFLVKFPLLYAVAVGLLMTPGVSAMGFGLGFSVTLAAALIASVVSALPDAHAVASHGR